jgi:hypothetical protein
LSVSGGIGSPRKTTCGSQIRRRNQPYKVADRRTPVDKSAGMRFSLNFGKIPRGI